MRCYELECHKKCKKTKLLWTTKESPRNFQLQRYNAGMLGAAAENTCAERHQENARPLDESRTASRGINCCFRETRFAPNG